jgi:2-keto-4-pentenoate hydratase/2-oxohepta-3-ene-1,7-dioic acid hydratase in catechol pathway
MVPVGPDRDFAALDVICRGNREALPHDRTANLAFPMPFLLSYISAIRTLEPGDLEAAARPRGRGPLKAGDVAEAESPDLAPLRNPVRAVEGRSGLGPFA